MASTFEIGSVEFGEAGPDDDIIAALSQPYDPDDWIREAEDLLELGGESVWTDGDGTEFVCNAEELRREHLRARPAAE